MDKPVFRRDLGLFIITQLVEAPDSQVSETVRAQLRTMQGHIPTCEDVDLFDFLVQLSKQPLTEVSSFVKVLCDLERFYTRPQDPYEQRKSQKQALEV